MEWKRIKDAKRGDMVYRDVPDKFVKNKLHYKKDGPLKIMTVSDGYAMLRHKRCFPFCEAVKDLFVQDDNQPTTENKQ